MYTDFTVKNFRVFDKDGTIVPLRPITILTGCNSAGKSSIVKALCLLKDFCLQLEADYEDGKKLQLERYKMDFQKSPNSLMGGFDLVRHRPTKNDKENRVIKEKKIDEVDENKWVIFEVVVESSWLLQDVVLHLEFGSLNWDDLNNGYLHAYSIKTMDGKVIYQAERDGESSMDFSIVKKSLLHFLYGQYAFSNWQNDIIYRQATCTYPENEDKEGNLFDETNKTILNNLGPTALVYLFEWQISHCHHMWKDGSRNPAGPILKKVPDYSFAQNIPSLGVYCYFPCLQTFKSFKKKDVRLEVNKRFEAQEMPISSLDRKIVDLFLNSFETSNAESLHEYISKSEDEKFFTSASVFKLRKKGFGFPVSYWNMELNSMLYDESNLPEKANWSVILSAMDIINKATTNTTQSLLDFDEINECWHYLTENSIDDYLRNIIEDIFVHLIPGSLTYSPTTIVQPKRLYSLEENNDFARTLKKYFDAKRIFEEDKDTGIYQLSGAHDIEKSYKPCMFIEKWLKQLGIADHIDIKSHVNGYGVTIHLYEDKDDTIGMQLADKGLGVLQLFAVLLKIEIAILEAKTNEELYKYDTSGLNKDVIKFLRNHNQLFPATVALEEPECHLHPSLQSTFADMLVDANKQYGINFLVESHSEYFIRKLQLLVSQKEIDCKDISLLYVNSASRPSYLPVITDIGIETDGTLKNEFGSGFFDESLRLSKELFRPKTDDDEEQA